MGLNYYICDILKLCRRNKEKKEENSCSYRIPSGKQMKRNKKQKEKRRENGRKEFEGK